MTYTTYARLGFPTGSGKAGPLESIYGARAPVQPVADEPYRCPRCERRAIVDEPCCGVPMVDDRHPHRLVREWPLRRAHRMPLMGLRTRARLSAFLDGRALREALSRVRVVTPIGAARGGIVRIEGRIELLRATRPPEDDPCAAYAQRAHVAERCHCRPGCRRRSAWLRIESDVGLFVVQDGSGCALVGDHGFPYLVASHRTRLVHGSRVAVVGPAAWMRREAPSRGYRDAQPKLLSFQPSSEEPCVIGPLDGG